MHINIAKINFKQIGINIAKVDFGLYDVVNYQDEYLTLSALDDGEITITIPDIIDQNYATSISYSKDKSNWTETVVDNTAQTITIPVTSGENVYLKCIAKQLSNSSANVNINSTANIDASGNIMSLLYGDDYKDKVAFQSGSSHTLAGLFENNKHLVNAGELILPATELVEWCYNRMFLGCTSLTTAPELPAIKAEVRCYSAMFNSCSSLTKAPQINANILAPTCFASMFEGCSSIKTAPELHATTLVGYCYHRMFYECTSLNSITMLATDISADSCLTKWVYNVASTGTFIKSPEMTSLPTGEQGIPTGWTVVDYEAEKDYLCFTSTGNSTISMTQNGMPDTSANKVIQYKLNNGQWQTWDLSAVSLGDGDKMYLKSDDEIPISESYVQDSTYYAFKQFVMTGSIAASGNIMSLLNFSTTLTEYVFYKLFENCTSLTTAPELPATTMAKNCYMAMFKGCTSLVQAPELPATKLVAVCYAGMFQGCTNLNYVKAMFTTMLPTSLTNWLNNVSPTGTFVKNAAATWTNVQAKIPTGWTVETASPDK